MFDIYAINQKAPTYEYVRTHIIILHQHVAVTPVTIIRVSYDDNKISTQTLVKKCDKTIFSLQFFSVSFLVLKKSIIILLKYNKIHMQ
jgi:hypothetical protein